MARSAMGAVVGTSILSAAVHALLHQPSGYLHLVVLFFPLYVGGRLGKKGAVDELGRFENARLFLTISSTLGAGVAAILAWSLRATSLPLVALDVLACAVYATGALVMSASVSVRDYIDAVDAGTL